MLPIPHVNGDRLGLATSPGTCAGTRGFIHGKARANRAPAYESPGAYKTREYGCQFWITRNPYGLPVQPVVSIRVLQQQRGGASPTPVTLATVAALAFALTLARRPRPACRPHRLRPHRPRPRPLSRSTLASITRHYASSAYPRRDYKFGQILSRFLSFALPFADT